MAFKATTITLNNGVNIDVPSISNASYISFKTFFGIDYDIAMPYRVTWYYNTIGNTTKPSVINLKEYAVEVGQSLSYEDRNYYWNILNRHSTADEVASDTYKMAEEAFDNGVVWLWGSLKQGGVFIGKGNGYSINNPRLYIGGIEGFYEEERAEEESLYYYNPMYQSGGNMPIAYDSRLVLFWNEEDDNTQLCFLFDIPSNSILGDDQWQWCEATTNLPNPYTQWSSETQQPSIIDIIERPEWTKTYNWVTLIQAEGNFLDMTVDMPSLIIREYGGATSHNTVNNLNCTFPSDTKISGDMLGDAFSEDDPMPPNYYGDGGGFGSYPSDNANIGDTDASQFGIDAINSGFVTLYKPTKQAIINLNDFLFSDSITDQIADKLKQLIANPLDYVLFIAQCHFNPITTTSEEIKYCGIRTGVYSEVIANQFHSIDCGWVDVVEPSRTFLDYAPNTKIKIYLPYIGVQELNVDDCMGGRVHVTYWIDLLTGACIAQVRCQRNKRVNTDVSINDVLYEFTGNCYITLPLTATDWRGMFTSMLQFVGGVAGVVGGAVGSSPSGIVSGLGQMGSSLMSQKVSVNRSGQAGTNYGYMGHQKPYLIYERPINNMPYNFKTKKGYVSNYGSSLRAIKGYTEIEADSLYITNFMGITEEEFEELKTICNGGIIL